MTVNMRLKYIGAILLANGLCANAQDTIPETIERNVEVVNTYLPTISNPHKLQAEPTMDDTMSYKPTFNYTTLTKVQTVKTTPDSLSAASMSFKADESPYRALLKVEGGNVLAAGELFYNIGNSDIYHLSLNAGHSTAYGKVKLTNDEKVKAPYHDTWAGADFNRFFKKHVLGLDLNFRNQAYEYYGLQTIENRRLLSDVDTTKLIDAETLMNEKKQRATKFDFDATFDNSIAEPREFVTYSAKAGFGIFSNKTGVKETDIRFGAKIRFPIKKNYLFDASVDVNNFKVAVPDKYDATIYSFKERKHTDISMKPHFGLDFDNAKLRVGFNFIFEFGDEEDNLYMQPDMMLDFNIAGDIVSFYTGIIGGYNANSFRSLVERNPYLAPDACNYVWRAEYNKYTKFDEMPTTQNPIRLVAGIKSRFSRSVAMHLGIDYRSFDDEIFFVNKVYNSLPILFMPSPDPYPISPAHTNRFAMLSDNGKLFIAHGEFNITPTDKSQIVLRANYYKWQLDYLEEAWYRPQFDLSLETRFYPADRLLVTANVDVLGNRYAYNHSTQSKVKLDNIFDINLGAEYFLTSRLSAFAKLNNLASQDYQRWLGYSSHRINALAGISFKF